MNVHGESGGCIGIARHCDAAEGPYVTLIERKERAEGLALMPSGGVRERPNQGTWCPLWRAPGVNVGQQVLVYG